MKKYQRKNSVYYIGALVFILISTVFAVVLQFFKGDVLDYAIAGDVGTTFRYAALLIGFILGEVLFYYGYRRFSARFSVGCTRLLKHDIFESIIRQDYVIYKEKQQGEYVAKYTNEADMIKSRYFQMNDKIPLFPDETSVLGDSAENHFRKSCPVPFGLADCIDYDFAFDNTALCPEAH